MKTPKICFFILFVAYLFPLSAENNDNVQQNPQTYTIAQVIYEIDGKTKKNQLDKKLDYPEGESFYSTDELTSYMSNLKQKLVNLQFFSDISVTYETFNTDQADNYNVIVHVAVKDALTFIILPGPKYNSNDGFSLKLKYKENNFLGTMESVFANLEFNQNYSDETKKNYPELAIDMSFSYPFMISSFNTKATLDSEIAFQNIATDDYLFRFNATAGLEIELYRNRVFSIATGVTQGIYYNDQDEDFNTYEGDELYYKEKAYINSCINIHDFDEWGKLTYNPVFSIDHNWDADGIDPMNTDIIGPQITFSHSLAFGQVNYSGLFRNGITATLDNAYTYNCDLNKHDFSITGNAKYYHQLLSRLGINSRIGFFSYLETKNNGMTFWGDGDESRGSYLRGIRNHRVKTDLGIYCSVDLPIHAFSFNAKNIAQTHFPNSKFMNKVFGSLGFDFIISPYVDAMLTHYNSAFYDTTEEIPHGDRYFSFEDAWYSAGADIIIVPHKFKSQTIRIGLGWDLEELLKQKSLTGKAKRDGESIYELVLSLSIEY